ncbi:hypothetical protein ECL_00530 [Enterobacter cloacae subsp. cloacae ATCC 13047]|uniref:Uncharacterized protein n=1 Tax=Enterobacter cloacae subsp. cloacae (strain ATCC 13047 / DSM 30054 / NBRC 13535 / NCTC 10005 / WDCM 00083 / NCDC 279-56) TaxID=716541 RepID=A0A0H3CG27_ENTCC|nr:hypothetical protein ECL_00530 [Enterobacter cloacae subsp. cloacae ATCC 13047]
MAPAGSLSPGRFSCLLLPVNQLSPRTITSAGICLLKMTLR